MAWMYLFVAGLLETGWAIGLKFSNGWSKPIPSALTVTSMVLSLMLLSQALKSLPISLAYAVWVGIGAVGVAIIGMIFLGESASPLKIACIALISLGIIGLKFTGH